MALASPWDVDTFMKSHRWTFDHQIKNMWDSSLFSSYSLSCCTLSLLPETSVMPDTEGGNIYIPLRLRNE